VCGFDGGRWIRFVALLCIASLLLFWIAVWYCRVIMMDDVEAVDWWKGKTLQRWIYPDRDERCRKDDDNNDDDIHISICGHLTF
jgi:hypothetical protein